MVIIYIDNIKDAKFFIKVKKNKTFGLTQCFKTSTIYFLLKNNELISNIGF
jgi:hypothetical protein